MLLVWISVWKHLILLHVAERMLLSNVDIANARMLNNDLMHTENNFAFFLNLLLWMCLHIFTCIWLYNWNGFCCQMKFKRINFFFGEHSATRIEATLHSIYIVIVVLNAMLTVHRIA